MHKHLGQASSYIQTYAPSLLEAVPRSLARASLGLMEGQPLPFYGEDLWNAYELSWLDAEGKPQVALAEFRVPASTPCLIESKSLKLYLNSFNQTVFASQAQVAERITQDLSAIAQGSVQVLVLPLAGMQESLYTHLPGESLDHLSIRDVQPVLKTLPGPIRKECLTSDLLKSNCPVTGQPDWGSIQIEWEGPPLDRSALLAYLISYRTHQEFHEHCVENIFLDLMKLGQARHLTVYARYTRRGGLDINPYRSTQANRQAINMRLIRQ